MRQGLANALRVGGAVAALQLSACDQGNKYVAPPPPKVTVATPTQQPVTRYLEATGNAAAVNSTDLVARVSGFVEKVPPIDGEMVTKGTVLFTIEREPYKVKLEQAQAAEVGAAATLKQMQDTYQRQKDLVARQSASQAQLDQALANRDAAQATVDQNKANTHLAQLNYDYTQVTAPFDGVVTARQVSIGQYVGGSGAPTVLATIVQFDPLYVNFNVAERDVLRARQEIAKRGLTSEDLRKVPIEIGLQDEAGYPHTGTLDYAAPNLDATTGTMLARAVLKNSDRKLLPGYFVRVRIPLIGETKTALLVPDTALGSDQGGRYVLVVGKDNVVEQRKIVIGPLVGSLRVIDDGIKADDHVIVGGLMRAIPGQKVDPQMAPATAANSGR